MLSLETLMREAPLDAATRKRVESVVAGLCAGSLREAIDALPERQRLVLALRHYEALQVGESAAVLGAKERQVEELLEKATLALCGKLERLARNTSPRTGATEGVRS